MGFMAETAILKTIEKAGKREDELLTALLAEQQKTNHLLTQLLTALGSPQRAERGTTWGRG